MTRWLLACPECTGTGTAVRRGGSRGVGFTTAAPCWVCDGKGSLWVPLGASARRRGR